MQNTAEVTITKILFLLQSIMNRKRKGKVKCQFPPFLTFLITIGYKRGRCLLHSAEMQIKIQELYNNNKSTIKNHNNQK